MSQATTPTAGPGAAPRVAVPVAPPPAQAPPGVAPGSAVLPGDGTPQPAPAAGRSRLAAALDRAQAGLAGGPGRLRVAAGIAILAALAVGLGSAQAVSVRRTALADARATTAHLVLLQNARTALVQADADATNSALSLYVPNTLEPAGARAEYVAAISTASRALAAAASGSAADAAQLGAANDALTRYTGTIESGRTLNRLNKPTGAYYFKSASGQLRTDVLPLLTTLAGNDEVRVAADYDRAVNARLWLLFLGLGGLLILVGVQAWLARQSRRFVNLPLAGATAGLAVLLAVTAVVAATAQGKADGVRNGDYQRTVALAQARVYAFDARSQLSLTLLSQGSGAAYKAAYADDVTNAGKLLPADQTAAKGALTEFGRLSDATLKSANAGQWQQAFAAAAAVDPRSANARFAAFEQATATALDQARSSATAGLEAAGAPLLLLAWLMLLAGLVGAALAWWGVSLRLDEYR